MADTIREGLLAELADTSAGQAGNAALGSKTLTITNGSTTFSGVIAGLGGGLTISGGTQTLAGTSNTYSGTTTINSNSTLAGGATHAFSASSAVTINGNGILDLGSTTQTIAALNSASTSAEVTSLSGTGTAGTLVVNNGGAYAGKIVDGHNASNAASTTALTLNGGTLTLSGTGNTYTGATTVNNTGTL